MIVVTMKHYWEVHIGLSESAKKFTLDNLEEVISRSRNLKYKKLIWCHDSAIPARAGLLVR
jgi:hypothetical protein